MKQVLKEVAEINRMYEAIEKTESPYLRRDYRFAIKKKKRELQKYCEFKKLSFTKVLKLIKEPKRRVAE